MKGKIDTAVFAGGCFWCTEAVFKRLRGVIDVTPGYSGGVVDDPSYEQVASGGTGHAEAIKIEFDPDKISYEDLLYVFWRIHDPTTLNRQGADVGTQYRSAVFYVNEEQKQIAGKAKDDIQKVYDDMIVTEIVPFKKFYPAEDYHMDYYTKNPNQGYCRLVIDPKIEKLEKDFNEMLRD